MSGDDYHGLRRFHDGCHVASSTHGADADLVSWIDSASADADQGGSYERPPGWGGLLSQPAHAEAATSVRLLLRPARNTPTLLECSDPVVNPLVADMNDPADRSDSDRQRAELLEGMLALFDGVQGAAQGTFVRRDLLDTLSQTVDRLSPLARQALIYSRVRGMTHSEIAATLGVSRAQVEAALVRALIQCRAAVLRRS